VKCELTCLLKQSWYRSIQTDSVRLSAITRQLPQFDCIEISMVRSRKQNIEVKAQIMYRYDKTSFDGLQTN
jgi:hypothetical protein